MSGDVTCRLDRLRLDRDRWTLGIALEFPPGGRTLESFQAGRLVVQNELRLVSADGKRTLAPTGYVVELGSSRRASPSGRTWSASASRSAHSAATCCG